MTRLTHILSDIQSGDCGAAEELLPLVYEELRRLAGAKMARERPGQTLEPTALVHEAYVRLLGADSEKQWDSRGHFFAAAAEAMRRILIERARRKMSVKGGGGLKRIDLDKLSVADEAQSRELLVLDEAISELERHDPQAAKLVKLRYFAGLSHQQAAEAMGIGRRAADRLWALARAWLYRQISDK
jgi:RNA polymerase sigma factor (TIGR02999 family)